MAIKFVKPVTAATGVATASQTESKAGTVTNEQAGDEVVKNDAGPDMISGPVAMVKVALSKTINMGDYNSVKVEVALEMPAEPNEKSVGETYDFSVAWVNAKIEELTAG